jgi:predicted ATP-dependent serine protease
MVSLSYYFLKNDTTCLWFSYEESSKDIWKRFQETGIEDKTPVFCPLNLSDNKLDYIEEVIKIQKQKTDFFVVFIDQLSFLAPKVPAKADINHIQGNYAMYLGMISQQLKNMAMEYGIIIIFAHQLGRTGDVAYSDMIKHAPDKVIYLKREPANSTSEDEFTDKTFVTFKKNRPFGTRPRLVMTVKDGLFVPYENPNPLVQYAKKQMGAKEVNQFKFD